MATTIGALRVELSANIAKFEAAMGKAAKNMARTQRSFERFGSQVTAAGQSLSIGLTAPLVAVGALATKSFLGFDQAMTRSLAIMGDVSDALRDDMATAAREVGKTTSFSASEAAEAYFFLASAGLDAVQSVEAMPKVAKFAQAGLFDLSTATDLLTDAQSALGLTIRDDAVANMQNMARVSDVLVKANTLANASVQQFSEALTNKAANAMAQLNIDIESGVAVLAAWADQGIKGSEAGERFNIVTRDLQTAVRKNADEFERFGIAVFDQAGNFRSLADIVADVEGALQGMSHEQQGATLAALGFTDRSIAATRSLIGSSEAIRGYERDLRSAGGTTQEVADKQLEGFTGAWIKLTSAVGDVLLEIGDRLSPVLERLAAIITDRILPAVRGALDAFGRLSPEVQTSRILWLGFAAALGPALIAIGGVALTPLVPLFGRIWIAAGRMSNVLVKALGHPIATAQALRARLVTLRTSLAGLSLSARASAVGVKLASVAMTGLRFAIRGVIAALGPMILVFAAFEFAAWAAGALKLGDKLKRLVGITDDTANAADRADQQWAEFSTTLDTTRAALDETTQQIDALTRKHERLTEQLEPAQTQYRRSIPGIKKRIAALEEEIETVERLHDERVKDVQFGEFLAPLAALAAKDLETWAAASREAKTAARELGVELSVAVKMDHLTRAVHTFAETSALTPIVMREIGTQAAALGVPLEDLPPELKNIVTWLNRTAAASAEAEPLVDELASGVGGLTDEVQTLVDRLRGTGAIQAAHDWAAALDHVGGITTLTDGETGHLVTTLQTAIDKFQALGQAIPADLFEAYVAATSRLRQIPVEAIQIPGVAVGGQSHADRMQAFREWHELARREIARVLPIGIPLEPELPPQVGSMVVSGLRRAFRGFSPQISQTFTRALEGGGGFMGAIQSLGVQGGDRLSTALTGAFVPKLASAASSAASGIASFALGGLAKAIPIVGPLVGKLFGALKKPSEAELAARKQVADYTQTIVKGLSASQLDEAADAAQGHWAGNERGAQFLIGVRDAYVAAGRSASEAERLVGRYWAASKDGGPEAVAAIEAQIDAVVQVGREQQQRLAELGALKEAGQAAFDPAQIEPYLATLLETGTITAQQGDQLRGLADEAHVDYQAMQRAAEAYGVELSALGPAFDQARISDAATVIVQDFELMTQEGADVNGVLRGMQDEVQALVTGALTAGVAIPEGMRPILTSLIEQGRLTDANGDKLTDLSGLTFAEPLAAKFDTLITKLTELIEKIAGRGGVTEAIDHIPREVEVGVDLRYREHDRPEGFAGVDVESARHGTPFRQFGRGTPAMLHGLERVMTGMEGWGIAAALGRITSGLAAIADLSGVRALAEGGLVTRPTLALLGERGPEVVMPRHEIAEFGGGRRVEAQLDQLHQDFALLLDEFRHGLDPRRRARALVVAAALSTA